MRHFVAVAEELHFGRAARRLNMAQPPLSQSIRRLELELGVDLFDRSRRSVELTDAGRAFLLAARRTLSQAEIAGKMAKRAGAKVPEVRVSFIGPALYQFLPDLLLRYRQAAPEVHVKLIEALSLPQIEGIQGGDFDVGFITAARSSAECESMIVERSELVVAVPADWPVAAAEAISLADLADLPAIQAPSILGGAMLQAAGFVPPVAQEATQTNTILSLVGAGLGCSIVMETAALAMPRNVRFLRIEPPPPVQICWELAMVWHPSHIDALTTDFIDFTRAYVRENPQLLSPDRVLSS